MLPVCLGLACSPDGLACTQAILRFTHMYTHSICSVWTNKTSFSISPYPLSARSVLKCERSLAKWFHLRAFGKKNVCYLRLTSSLPSSSAAHTWGLCSSSSGSSEKAPQCARDLIRTPFTQRNSPKGVFDKERISPLSPPDHMHTGRGLWDTQRFYCGEECLNSHPTAGRHWTCACSHTQCNLKREMSNLQLLWYRLSRLLGENTKHQTVPAPQVCCFSLWTKYLCC